MFPAVEDVNSKLIYIFVDPHGSAGKSANESFVIADSFLTACSQLGKGSGIGWPKWWNQVAHSLYRCLSCYFDKDSHPILWSLVDRASCNVFYTLSHERRCCGFDFHELFMNFLKKAILNLYFLSSGIMVGEGWCPTVQRAPTSRSQPRWSSCPSCRSSPPPASRRRERSAQR